MHVVFDFATLEGPFLESRSLADPLPGCAGERALRALGAELAAERERRASTPDAPAPTSFAWAIEDLVTEDLAGLLNVLNRFREAMHGGGMHFAGAFLFLLVAHVAEAFADRVMGAEPRRVLDVH